VVSVDAQKSVFVVNDGSYGAGNSGLAVYYGSLRRPVGTPPKIGQYVAVTGVSTTWVDSKDRHIPAVRIRSSQDIQTLSGE